MRDNDFAFPFVRSDREQYAGLTRRELFAAMAMQALLTAPEDTFQESTVVASDAVKCADALIAELDK